MNTIDREIKNYNLQIIASLLFIISIIISIILTYNEELELLDDDIIFDNKTQNKVNIGNRIFSLFIVLLFLYCSFVSYNIEKEKGNDREGLKFIIFVNFITLISNLISLYVAIKFKKQDIDFANTGF